MQQQAGWYPDPEQPGQERYWFGTQWSAQRRPAHGPPPPRPPAPGGGHRGRNIALGAVAVVALIVIIAIAASGGSTKNTPTAATSPTTAARVTTPAVAATATAPPTAPPTTSGFSDKGWTVVAGSLQTANDGLGDFGGTVRVTNTNADSRSATFTLTLFRGSAQVATLQGSADAVSAGQTVTVQLISQNAYSAGPTTFTFQTDVSF